MKVASQVNRLRRGEAVVTASYRSFEIKTFDTEIQVGMRI